MSAVELGKRIGWDLELVRVTECEHQEGHECAEDSERGHPPDVPDQGKAGDDGEEGSDGAGRSILRHLDRLVHARRRWLTLPGGDEPLVGPVASLAETCGMTAKFQAGGGDAVDHSSVRPFQGSPVTSRSCSRFRIETTSCTTWQAIPARTMTAPASATHSHGCQERTS